MKNLNNTIGKVLYAIVFLFFLPIGLWIWARYTDDLVPFPVIESEEVGWLLAVGGGLLMLWAMYALWYYGRGLPMNAFPPSKLVSQGPYRLSRNPIYWGFGLMLTGVFIITGSSSGLWLVTPTVILGMLALVIGYEAL